MILLFERKKLFTITIFLSALAHMLILSGITFTLTLTRPSGITFLSFIGSVLTDKDVIYSMSSVATVIPQRSQSPVLNLTYGQVNSVTDALQQTKPRTIVKRGAEQKIFLKSTFLPPKEVPIASPPPTDEQFQLKEPLHVPLKLEIHDQN